MRLGAETARLGTQFDSKNANTMCELHLPARHSATDMGNSPVLKQQFQADDNQYCCCSQIGRKIVALASHRINK